MGEVIDLTPAPGPSYTAPVPLSDQHDVSTFDCGKPPLNDWLRLRAVVAEGGSARSYVVCQNVVVVGYYCLAAGSVFHTGTPRSLRQNMPDPTPVMVLGRLAIDKRHQGRGIGRGLLKDAFARVLHASRSVGAKAVIVHAIDDEAVPFYLQYGFKQFPADQRTLFLPIADIAAAL